MAPGKINLIFCKEIWEFTSTSLTLLYLVKNFRVSILTSKRSHSQDFLGLASEFQDFPGLENDFWNSETVKDFQDLYEPCREGGVHFPPISATAKYSFALFQN